MLTDLVPWESYFIPKADLVETELEIFKSGDFNFDQNGKERNLFKSLKYIIQLLMQNLEPKYSG